ncbi:MAG: TGS domain-containing protein, partial [Pseudomonadota bacterium]
LEVQIRTKEMHQYAEYGVAAHWAYKEGKKARSEDHQFNLLRQLMDWHKDAARSEAEAVESDPSALAESLKTDIFRDRVYVFTPRGGVLDLPRGATVLDFAYRVHTNVGHRCRGAKIDDHIVPLDRKLENGDRVEVLTKKHPETTAAPFVWPRQ